MSDAINQMIKERLAIMEEKEIQHRIDMATEEACQKQINRVYIFVALCFATNVFLTFFVSVL